MEFPGFALDLGALKKSVRAEAEVTYDVLILGGGPAALSAAIYAARKVLKLALLTREFGGQVGDTSAIENYIGFQSITGRELADKFVAHVKQFDIPLAEGVTVTEVSKRGELFEVQTAGGVTYRARTVIMATGKRYRRLNVPGEQELAGRGVAYCAICDAPFFKGKRVVVAGGGNSAFTAALDLLKLNAELTLVNLAAGWQADPVLREPVQKHERARLLDRHVVTRIDGAEQVSAVHLRDLRSGAEEMVAAEGVFVEIGLSPNSEPVSQLATLNAARELVIDCYCRTSVEGLFGAGDVTTVPYNQIIISAGEGAKAALAAYDYLITRGLA